MVKDIRAAMNMCENVCVMLVNGCRISVSVCECVCVCLCVFIFGDNVMSARVCSVCLSVCVCIRFAITTPAIGAYIVSEGY